MYNTICLPLSHILIILCIFIGFSTIYNEKQRKENLSNNMVPQVVPQVVPQTVVPQTVVSKKIIEEPAMFQSVKSDPDRERRSFINNRDTEVVSNIFVAPERRQPSHSYPYDHVKNQLNIPTRGYPDNYHMYGLVLRDNTETAYKLFGRQKFPGSNQYEYFVQSVMHNNDVKIPIKINGDKEIEDGQNIMVPGTNKNIGEFKVKLYEYDAPRYIPL
jgi:hypothetical protein